MRTDWHSLSADALEQALQSTIDEGLTEREATHRLATVDPNELPKAAPPSPLAIFFAQFSGLIVWVLIDAFCLHTKPSSNWKVQGVRLIIMMSERLKASRKLVLRWPRKAEWLCPYFHRTRSG